MIVDVNDVNDNAPVFTQQSYTAVVPENAPVDWSVSHVEARDPDEGDGGKVQYSLVAEGRLEGIILFPLFFFFFFFFLLLTPSLCDLNPTWSWICIIWIDWIRQDCWRWFRIRVTLSWKDLWRVKDALNPTCWPSEAKIRSVSRFPPGSFETSQDCLRRFFQIPWGCLKRFYVFINATIITFPKWREIRRCSPTWKCSSTWAISQPMTEFLPSLNRHSESKLPSSRFIYPSIH